MGELLTRTVNELRLLNLGTEKAVRIACGEMDTIRESRFGSEVHGGRWEVE